MSMDFDITFFLIGLPIAFLIGWLASRLDVRQLSIENKQAPKAYFKGLNFLLNEQQDQAIDAFIEAVQKDPDTSELHFALGNLFRRRGEYERAVRVHEHLLLRGDLSERDHQRAQHALAIDYLKAGILDRAEVELFKLEGTPFETEAQLALLANFERGRDWVQATHIAEKLEYSQPGVFRTRLAHYLCEQALSLASQGKTNSHVNQLLKKAIGLAPHAARARIVLANLLEQQGELVLAYDELAQAISFSPKNAPLVALELAKIAKFSIKNADAITLLKGAYEKSPSLDVLDAIIALKNNSQLNELQGHDMYVTHLELHQSLVAATKWLSSEKFERHQHHPKIQETLELASLPLSRYRCAACGFETHQYFWHCPGCQTWDSFPALRVGEM